MVTESHGPPSKARDLPRSVFGGVSKGWWLMALHPTSRVRATQQVNLALGLRRSHWDSWVAIWFVGLRSILTTFRRLSK